MLRQLKQATTGYLRDERDIHLLCDDKRTAREASMGWIDLREASIPVLDYDLRAVPWNQRGAWRLEIALQQGVMAKARATIKAIVRGGQSAG